MTESQFQILDTEAPSSDPLAPGGGLHKIQKVMSMHERENCIERMTKAEKHRMNVIWDLVFGGFIDNKRWLSEKATTAFGDGKLDRGRTYSDLRSKFWSVANAVSNVAALTVHFRGQWEDKDEAYWMQRLEEEVEELKASLAGEHKDAPLHELLQIASIATNWIAYRMTGHFSKDNSDD